MKNVRSLVSCFIILLALLQYRYYYSDAGHVKQPLKVTVWDAFGYYAYLPAICIYHDYKDLKWLTAIDEKYSVTGGNGWQAEKLPDGHYTFKYLGGVALMQLPFFYIGHIIATHSHYPPDGFSPPYQYALGFGIVFYCFFALLLLRRLLLRYFSDTAVAISLILLCLASNFIQYAAIDNGQSHAYLFCVYVLVLCATRRWHEWPTAAWALAIGYLIGLGTMTRPTEAIMLFIPVMWGTQNKEAAKAKWQMVKAHKPHIAFAALGGLLGILPQLVYWKQSTGGWVYDVGSKWDFLNPHFRVLFGWEKGWFVYTPVTVLFIAGMWYIRRFPFRKSVLWFCLLNIYVIIGWHEWRYGGSYSTRALVQSYAVFALPLTAVTDRVLAMRWRIPFLLVCIYLLGVNFFQIYQYNLTILHFDDMNRRYYGAIYLNPHPSPVDMSLLDNDASLPNERHLQKKILLNNTQQQSISFAANEQKILATIPISATTKEHWLKVESDIRAPRCLWQTFLQARMVYGKDTAQAKARLYSPIAEDSTVNGYAFFVRVPGQATGNMEIFLGSPFAFYGQVHTLRITEEYK